MRLDQNVTLMQGSIRFLDNAKLCLSVIRDFVSRVHVASGLQPVIPEATNGYSAICRSTSHDCISSTVIIGKMPIPPQFFLNFNFSLLQNVLPKHKIEN